MAIFNSYVSLPEGTFKHVPTFSQFIAKKNAVTVSYPPPHLMTQKYTMTDNLPVCELEHYHLR